MADMRVQTYGNEEAARLIGCAPKTLESWRWSGRGPRFVKVGGKVRYRACDLAAWLDSLPGGPARRGEGETSGEGEAAEFGEG